MEQQSQENQNHNTIQCHIDNIKSLDGIHIKNLKTYFENLCQAIVDAQKDGLTIAIYGFDGEIKKPFPNYNPVKLFVARNIDLFNRQI